MKFDKHLIAEAIRESKYFILSILFAVLTTVFVVLQAREIASILNQIFIEKALPSDLLTFVRPLLIILFLRATTLWVSEYTARFGALRIMERIRVSLMEKLFRLGPAYSEEQETGKTVNILINGVDQLNAYFSQYLPQVVLAAALPILFLVFVFPIDWVSGVVMLVTAPLVPIFMILVGRASERITTKQWGILNRLAGFLLDTVQGLRDIKTLGASAFWRGKLVDATERYRLATMEVLRITFLSALILELVSTISTAVIAVEIGLRLLYARMSFEQAFFILLLAPEFYLPLRMLGQRFHAGMAGVAAAKDIFAILNKPDLVNKTVEQEQGDEKALLLQDISYRYPGAENYALKDVNLRLEEGKVYAVVGPSGSGKSTLFEIILGFRSPSAGIMVYRGVQPFTNPWENSGWISQNPYIFAGNVSGNIDLKSESPDPGTVQLSVQRAGLHEVIMGLPDGLNSPLTEFGGNLSGGQIQRLGLARVYHKDASIILLDEPTAHLDTLLEEEFIQELEHLKKGRIVLVIAHRPGTVRLVDETIFVNNGEVRLVSPTDREAFIESMLTGGKL
ncbi:MAG TPA: thiol reductant ABC exporter subunit CydD [Bellilinea sp.]|nr:thiol reductant ABC exporter subunit CydD [Bellilinea sp.]